MKKKKISENKPAAIQPIKKPFEGFHILGGVQQSSGQLGAGACCNKC